MSIIDYFRISEPAADKVPEDKAEAEYKKFRNRTFWGVIAAYSLYYLCRMALSVVKQPVIDSGALTASGLGIIGSALSFVYAIGKFTNGFMADYCNIRRFMAVGLLVSSVLNLIMGILGLMHGALGLTSGLLFVCFAICWGLNGWTQSMGSPPAVISLSRWFPLSRRGMFYSILCATPYIGKFASMVITGYVVVLIGWQYGFIFSAIGGVLGSVVVLLFVCDTPESKGLPSIQEISKEEGRKTDGMSVSALHKMVLRSPAIWIIALSSAFVYITQTGLSSWGVLFLQKSKDYSLTEAAWIIGFSEAFGIAGTVLSGWLSDKVFKGDRLRPVLIGGVLSLCSMAAFLLTRGSAALNIVYVAVFSLSMGMLYCIVSGLMALDIVPRKATGAALGVVGISSYLAVGIQDIVSGFLIDGHAEGADYDFLPVAIFWLSACLVSFLLPLLGWRKMKKQMLVF